MLLNLLIVAPQTVDAEHQQQVAGAQGVHQPLVLGAVEVFAGLLVYKNSLGRRACLLQRRRASFWSQLDTRA